MILLFFLTPFIYLDSKYEDIQYIFLYIKIKNHNVFLFNNLYIYLGLSRGYPTFKNN